MCLSVCSVCVFVCDAEQLSLCDSCEAGPRLVVMFVKTAGPLLVSTHRRRCCLCRVFLCIDVAGDSCCLVPACQPQLVAETQRPTTLCHTGKGHGAGM